MSTINVTYIGGPTVILEINGVRLITDPTFDPAGTEFPDKKNPLYWKTEDPYVTDVSGIDAVLLSHDQHGDNLDHGGRLLLQQVPQTFTTVVGAGRLGGNATGLANWQTVSLKNGVTITGAPARHGPAGSEALTGDVTGFIVTADDVQIYITGDTVFYNGIEEIARRYKPRYVFIFAGAAKPRGPFNVTMGANDALDTAAAFAGATIIPIHFEGWSHYTEGAEVLAKAFGVLGIGHRLRVLQKGQTEIL